MNEPAEICSFCGEQEQSEDMALLQVGIDASGEALLWCGCDTA
jgi:hypothetical protein